MSSQGGFSHNSPYMRKKAKAAKEAEKKKARAAKEAKEAKRKAAANFSKLIGRGISHFRRGQSQGHGVVERELVEAERLFKLAAEERPSSGRAHFCLGMVALERGKVTEAVRFFTLGAKQGDRNAQCNLGVMYEEGRGIERNLAEAARLYMLAAKQGVPLSQYNLGAMYEEGRGVQCNLRKAAWLYTRAAKQGDRDAQYYLGVMYEEGRGVERNLAEAARLYTLAVEQGNRNAQFKLAVMYGEGRGVKRDLAEAARLFKLVVEQGLEIKPINLGIMNERLGFMCEHGLGGAERDLAEATRLYTLAVDQGNRNAQWRLGAMYEEGRGVARDLGKAAKLLTLAAEQGHRHAVYALARVIESGKGADHLEAAARMYALAAEQGVEEAGPAYVRLVQVAARPRSEGGKTEKGDARAQYRLGEIYCRGAYGINKDLKKAETWLRRAADQGSEKALYAHTRLVERDATRDAYARSEAAAAAATAGSRHRRSQPHSTYAGPASGLRAVDAWAERDAALRSERAKLRRKHDREESAKRRADAAKRRADAVQRRDDAEAAHQASRGAAPFERGDVVTLKHPPPAGSGCSLCIVSSCAECVPPAEGAWTVSTFCDQHNDVPAATFVRAEISKHGHLAFDRVCDESIYYHYPVSADKWRSPDAPIPLPPE